MIWPTGVNYKGYCITIPLLIITIFFTILFYNLLLYNSKNVLHLKEVAYTCMIFTCITYSDNIIFAVSSFCLILQFKHEICLTIHFRLQTQLGRVQRSLLLLRKA